MLQLNDDGVLEKVDEEKLVTVDEEELDELINRYDELHKRNEQLNENNLHLHHELRLKNDKVLELEKENEELKEELNKWRNGTLGIAKEK